MANAIDMLELASKGDFGNTDAAELLGSLEAARASVRIWLETEIGVGQLAMNQGQIVVAEVGPLRKRTALLRILTLTEGTYSIEAATVVAGPAIVPSVDAALRILSDRQQEWRILCESSPSMSSVLRLSAAGRGAKGDSTGTERMVYLLVDGRRTIMDILGESELDPIDALRAIVRGVDAGAFEDIENSASLMPLPIEEISGEVVKIPAAPMVPRFQSTRAGVRRPSEIGGIRKGTLVGLGVDLASSTSPPRSPDSARLRASPIIDLGGDSNHQKGGVPWGSDWALVEPAKSFESRQRTSDPPPAISEPADSLLGNAKPSPVGVAREAGTSIRYVGRYEVIHRIGRGGMGSVYLARLTARGGFRRLFALKLLRSYLARDSAAAEAFLGEARLAGQLHHPNVVGVVDAGLHDEQPYLVMDYVEGCSLKQLMMAHPDLRPPRLIVPIILGALDGLAAVHSLRADDGSPLNVVHCDVSPENLLVGADGICRLTDFGVARRAQLEGAKNIHGKPGYVAPEQVSGGAIDQRVDLFALGVVLWSALTGERLFSGNTVEETLQRVCNHPVAIPSTVGLRPPTAFDAVCLKALERDVERRYSSAEEMQADLRETAMKEGMIGLNSEIASWVRRTVGQQLSQRRLLVLEANQPSGFAVGHVASADDENLEVERDARKPFSSAPAPASRRFAELGDEPESRTMPLQSVEKPGRGKQIALVLAAALALSLVLVAILWPAALARLFKMESQSALDSTRSTGLSVGLPVAPIKAPSRTAKPPTVTPVPNSTRAPSAGPQDPKEH